MLLVPALQVWCAGLPDLLGAEMASSRWRVCVAFYSQLILFLVAGFVSKAFHTWTYAAALATALVWWLGVVRDHQKDDLKHLQTLIGVVGGELQALQACLEAVDDAARQQQLEQQQQRDADALCARCRTLCGKLELLLGGMQQREGRMCSRFRALSSSGL